MLSRAKTGFLLLGNELPVQRFTGPENPVLVTLLEGLMHFFQSRVQQIGQAISSAHYKPFPEYSPAEAQKEYDGFLDLICDAIAKIPEPVASVSSSPDVPTPTKRSRDYTDDEELVPPRKRPTPSNSPRNDMPSTAKFNRPSRLKVGPAPNTYKDCSGSEDSSGDSPNSPSPPSNNKDAQEWTARSGY
ncbi:hypothetical protein C8R45DRAFT_1018418 [Mycena sanguinolenta]|nr:hypothetical protein C8R45DRAFT_1018418 [Mycena sanguinolenta]